MFRLKDQTLTLYLIILTQTLGISHTSSIENGVNETSNYDDEDPGDPWETPLQELQYTTSSCAEKDPGYLQTALQAQKNWQNCTDSLIPKYLILSRNAVGENAELNSTVIHELDKQIHLAVCRDTTAYKACWTDVLEALNKCEPGSGDVSGKLYFALYDEICKDGGSITIQKRRTAAEEGRLCERDYFTRECRINAQKFRRSKDLCLRFLSNTACDISSVDRNCANKADKEIHNEIFENVGKVFKCSSQPSSNVDRSKNGASSSCASQILSLITVLGILFSRSHFPFH